MDAAMVCESMGEITYGDKGNMTKEEIDKTMAIFTEAKKAGQFRAFWKEFNESVNLMASGEVVIQSMWSPAVKANIALAMIQTEHLAGDIWVEIYKYKDLRPYRRMARATIRKKPFWTPARARATPPADF